MVPSSTTMKMKVGKYAVGMNLKEYDRKHLVMKFTLALREIRGFYSPKQQ